LILWGEYNVGNEKYREIITFSRDFLRAGIYWESGGTAEGTAESWLNLALKKSGHDVRFLKKRQ
jgi:hypothetical protein